VNSHHSTEHQKPGNTSGAVSKFDQLAKMLGFVFGALYILGLIITNAELQHLGLSDFSILQPRCIATGMLFVLYMIFALLLLAPIGGLLVGSILLIDSNRALTSKVGLLIGLVAFCLFAEFLLFFLASLLYGSLTPWIFVSHPDWFAEYSKQSFSDRMIGLWYLLQQGWNLFGYLWAGLGGVFIAIWIAAELAEYVPNRARGFDGRAGFAVAGVIALLVYSVPGFARDVYPNLDQSVGGGQPTIARLQISGTLPLIEDGKTFRRVTEQALGKEPKSYIMTEPLVIWYQSASFIYVSPLIVNDRRQRPIAVDAKSVQIMQQVALAVEVRDGTKITAVHELR
jgi:MFS family permease